MSSKSVTQRVIEGIALVAVVACAVPVAIAVWGHFNNPAPVAQQRPSVDPATIASATPASSGLPQRESVDSVAKLPKTYPALADLTLPRPGASAGPSAARREGVTVRHLNAFVRNHVLVSPDTKAAIVFERTPANTTRLAVWDLDAGKLVRFLSGEVGKESAAYRGEENANFGAKVDFAELHWGQFSPDGRKFAAQEGIDSFSPTKTLRVWDIASGKLLWQTAEVPEHGVVVFASPQYLAISSPAGMREDTWRRVDAATGESELLLPAQAGAGPTSECALFAGRIAFLRQDRLSTLDVASRQLQTGPDSDQSQRRPGRRHLWYSADGSEVLGFNRNQDAWVDVWELPAHKLTRSIKIASERGSLHDVYPCLAENLLGTQVESRSVQFYDLATGEQRFGLQLPFRGTPLKGVSGDARRFVIQTDQDSLLVIDFTGELPSETVELSTLVASSPLPGSR